MTKELKKEIWSYFKDTNIIYLATSANNRPAVRPVTLIFHNERFFVATGSKDAKIKQININNNIEFCFSISDGKNAGYIRGFGQAMFTEDIPTKKEIMDVFEYIKHFWKEPDDPGYILLEIKLAEIEYMKIGEMWAKREKI